jgi:hypothetical protein
MCDLWLFIPETTEDTEHVYVTFTWKLLKACLVQDTSQCHIYVRRKCYRSVACYKFTTYCTQIHKHLYSEGERYCLSYCIYIRTKFALPSASLNDKLYSRHFPSCFSNFWVRSIQQAKTIRQREANLDVYEFVHRDTTMKITNKVHYID